MKITIDTKEDSHEEIKKVIGLLTHMVGEQPVSNQPNIFDDSDSFGVSAPSEEAPVESTPAPSGNVFGNMFDSSAQSPVDPSTTPETPSAEEKEDPPEIIPY